MRSAALPAQQHHVRQQRRRRRRRRSEGEVGVSQPVWDQGSHEERSGRGQRTQTGLGDSACVSVEWKYMYMMYIYMASNESENYKYRVYTFLEASVEQDTFSLIHGRERDTSSDNSTSCKR